MAYLSVFLNLLIYWYSNLTSLVKWNGVFSDTFRVYSGVRQGGVLSPRLFVVYIDDLIQQLKKLNIGCHVIDIFFACIVLLVLSMLTISVYWPPVVLF